MTLAVNRDDLKLQNVGGNDDAKKRLDRSQPELKPESERGDEASFPGPAVTITVIPHAPPQVHIEHVLIDGTAFFILRNFDVHWPSGYMLVGSRTASSARVRRYISRFTQ